MCSSIEGSSLECSPELVQNRVRDKTERKRRCPKGHRGEDRRGRLFLAQYRRGLGALPDSKKMNHARSQFFYSCPSLSEEEANDLHGVHSSFYYEHTKNRAISKRATMIRPNCIITTFAIVFGEALTPAVWKHGMTQSIHVIRGDLYNKDVSFCVGSLCLYRVFGDVDEFPISSGDSYSSQSPNFTCELVNNLVDVYCCASRSQCETWIRRYLGEEFKIVCRAFTLLAKLQFPACNTCFGVHYDKPCPFTHPS